MVSNRSSMVPAHHMDLDPNTTRLLLTISDFLGKTIPGLVGIWYLKLPWRSSPRHNNATPTQVTGPHCIMLDRARSTLQMWSTTDTDTVTSLSMILTLFILYIEYRHWCEQYLLLQRQWYLIKLLLALQTSDFWSCKTSWWVMSRDMYFQRALAKCQLVPVLVLSDNC